MNSLFQKYSKKYKILIPSTEISDAGSNFSDIHQYIEKYKIGNYMPCVFEYIIKDHKRIDAVFYEIDKDVNGFDFFTGFTLNQNSILNMWDFIFMQSKTAFLMYHTDSFSDYSKMKFLL